ncbi:MAG: tetratricopeptide repeat protein [Elusimicrobiaceae bacterium]|nr:tetratricopeptide repeat protein [Elusimicrobiaceae bacterium]
MKKLLLLVTLGLCFTTVKAQDFATQAEPLYRSGQYAQALLNYEQALKNSPNNPYLYYNIGNCYFKMGSKGLAAANYYRAFKLLPRDPDIRHNLALALASGGEHLVPPGMPEALHKGLYWFSLTELKGLVYAVGWLLCLGAGLWLLTRKGGKLTVALGILFLICAGWFYVRHSWETEPLAVVAAPVVEVRSGPGQNFPASASVQQGHLVELADRKDNWQQVIVKSQGLKGWVESSTLERI